MTEVETTALPPPWRVHRDDDVAVITFAGGHRRTMGIDAADQLAALLAERATRAEPPVVVLEVDVLHAELAEVLEMAHGRPIADWAPWLAAIGGMESYPSATVVSVPRQATCGGLELALAADVRVAAPDARLASSRREWASCRVPVARSGCPTWWARATRISSSCLERASAASRPIGWD